MGWCRWGGAFLWWCAAGIGFLAEGGGAGRTPSRETSGTGLLGASPFPSVLVEVGWVRTRDAASWRAGRDPWHRPSLGCIHPAPFGSQCTVPRQTALAACIVADCTALVCPDQTPYTASGRLARRGVRGPICQLRNHTDLDETGHAMCRPGGCTLWTLHRKPLASSPLVAQLQRAWSPDLDRGAQLDQSLVVVVAPATFARFECRQAARATDFCRACVDPAPLHLELLAAVHVPQPQELYSAAPNPHSKLPRAAGARSDWSFACAFGSLRSHALNESGLEPGMRVL